MIQGRCLAVGVVASLASMVTGEVTLGGPEGQPLPPELDVLPELPHPRLAPFNKSTDESKRQADLADFIDQAVEQARAVEDHAERAAKLLEAANRILSHQVEPACSDHFLRIDRHDAQETLQAARRAIDRARSLLTEATDDVAKIPADESGGAKTELERGIARLDAFAAAIRLDLRTDESADHAKEIRQAISKLSPLLESSDLAVAGAAGFWRACLQAKDANPKTAMAGLELAVADVPAESARFGFYKRLLRCRLVGASKGEPAALALLSQVEERIDEWFHNEPDRLDAMRTVSWFQLQSLRSWFDRLDPTSQAEERGWIVKQIQKVIAERFAGGDNETLLRLVEAVPFPKPADAPPPENPEKADKQEKPEVPPPE